MILSKDQLKFVVEMSVSAEFDDQLWAASVYKELQMDCKRVQDKIKDKEKLAVVIEKFNQLMEEI